MKLEATNVFLIFDDDEVWLRYLQQEYPSHVHKSYLSNRAPIVQYYEDVLKSCTVPLNDRERDMFERCVRQKVRKDPQSHKYMIPYRMLFERYLVDSEDKKRQSEERLRQSVHKLDEERRQKQTVTVDYSTIIRERSLLPGRGKKRKQYWDDRTPIKSIDKHNKAAAAMAARVPPARVAFGGAAGRQTSNTAPKVLSSPMSELRRMDSHGAYANRASRDSNKRQSTSSPEVSDTEDASAARVMKPRPTAPPVSRRREPSSRQNIFLNKKSIPPLRRAKSGEAGAVKRCSEHPLRGTVSSPETSPRKCESQPNTQKNRVSLSQYKPPDRRPTTNQVPPRRELKQISPRQEPSRQIPPKATSPRRTPPPPPPKKQKGTRKQSKFFHNQNVDPMPERPAITAHIAAPSRPTVPPEPAAETAAPTPPVPKRTRSLQSYLSKR